MPRVRKSVLLSGKSPDRNGPALRKKIVPLRTGIPPLNGMPEPNWRARAHTVEQRASKLAHSSAAVDLLRQIARALQAAEAPGLAAWAVLGSKIFLNLREAAEYAGLPLATIRRLVAREDLPAVRLGGGWRIKRKYLELLDLRHLRKVESRGNPL